MPKERYIKIGSHYLPIDGVRWMANEEALEVAFCEIGSSDDFQTIATGLDAAHLMYLLDELSFDVSLLKDQVNG